MKNNVTKEQARLRRKIKVLNDIFDGTKFCGCMLTGFAAVMLAIGSVSGFASDMAMKERAEAVYDTAEFQTVAIEGIAKLDEKLANGKIGQQEYREGVDAIYSIPAVVEYAKNADDEELSQFVHSYEETQEIADSSLGVGLPMFGVSAAAFFGISASANNSKKKKESELEASGMYDVQRYFD